MIFDLFQTNFCKIKKVWVFWSLRKEKRHWHNWKHLHLDTFLIPSRVKFFLIILPLQYSSVYLFWVKNIFNCLSEISFSLGPKILERLPFLLVLFSERSRIKVWEQKNFKHIIFIGKLKQIPEKKFLLSSKLRDFFVRSQKP